jgi:periplasmic protein TonB
MFADSFCDTTWTNRSHRGWTTLASFALQGLAVGGLLVLPLLFTQALPQFQLLRPALIAPPPRPTSPAEQRRVKNASANNIMRDTLFTPPHIPDVIANLNANQVPAPPELPAGYGVPGGTGAQNARNPVLDSIGDALNAIAPPPIAHLPRTSVMMEGNLIHRVQPVYPPLAIQARIQGSVVLRAVISREGMIENLQLISGHPILVRAAMGAVRQWRYRPYSLNHEPVEVETQVTVNFVLSER